MSCVKFLSFNLADQSSTDLNASTVDPLFPLSNLKDPRGTKVWRSTSAVDPSVVFDVKTIEAVDHVAVRGITNDVAGFGQTITVEANPTNVWSAPAFSTTITFNYEFNLGFTSFPTEPYRFWRFAFTADQYAEVANIYIGKATEFVDNDIGTDFRFKNTDRSVSRSNRYGQGFFDVINSRREFRAKYGLMNQSEFTDISNMFNYHGKHVPVWMIFDDTETIIDQSERFSGMYYFSDRPQFSYRPFGLYDASFKMQEVT